MIGDYQRGAVMKHTRRLLQRLRMIELFKVLGMTVHQVNRIRKKIVIISSSDYCIVGGKYYYVLHGQAILVEVILPVN